MKLKRAKAYRKLMHQYGLQFGFREPYQVLLDSAILEDAYRFKIDLVSRLEGVLQGKIKPMITQCSIRHLYNAKPKNNELIEQAKGYERRRCNHHELENPLSSLECLSSVVDPKDNLTNKHRYVVASQDREVRAHMRTIAGVPQVYISKSVMIMEPMNTVSEEQREREERSKFRAGLKGQRNPDAGQKRKRAEEEEVDESSVAGEVADRSRPQKKKKQKGPKQPNPLSMRKSTKQQASGKEARAKFADQKAEQPSGSEATISGAPPSENPGHRKRKRRPKSKAEDGGAGTGAGDVPSS